MNKTSYLIISSTIIIVIAIIIFSSRGSNTTSYSNNNLNQAISSNVTTENSKQIITITAKGGYTPRSTVAKANTPTILRVKTDNSFDCSISLRIPAINYFKNLSSNGTEDIELPNEPDGTNLKGICSMGMYSFNIKFQG